MKVKNELGDDSPVRLRIDWDDEAKLCFQDVNGNEVLRVDLYTDEIWVE